VAFSHQELPLGVGVLAQHPTAWRAAFEHGLSRLSTTSWNLSALLLQLFHTKKPVLYLLPFCLGGGGVIALQGTIMHFFLVCS
jgi:hypothetical protein